MVLFASWGIEHSNLSLSLSLSLSIYLHMWTSKTIVFDFVKKWYRLRRVPNWVAEPAGSRRPPSAATGRVQLLEGCVGHLLVTGKLIISLPPTALHAWLLRFAGSRRCAKHTCFSTYLTDLVLIFRSLNSGPHSQLRATISSNWLQEMRKIVESETAVGLGCSALFIFVIFELNRVGLICCNSMIVAQCSVVFGGLRENNMVMAKCPFPYE